MSPGISEYIIDGKVVMMKCKRLLQPMTNSRTSFPSHSFRSSSAPASRRGLVDAVVMEIPSAPDSVTMEMPLGDAAAGPQEKSEIVQHLGQQRCIGPPFCQTRYYMLIVIGEIASDHQLDSVKEHIKQGESPTFGLFCLCSAWRVQ